MTRNEALERISKPELDEQTMMQDFDFVAKKLDMNTSDLQKLFEGENKTYRDYKNKMALITLGNKAMRMFGMEKRLVR
jgi:hypothetical protein